MNRFLLLTTGLATICSTAAYAQTAPGSDTDATPTGAADQAVSKATSNSRPAGNDIVVTGIRRANNAAVDAKRNSINIIDAVGSTDVRQLPDNTIVEAVRRIPGIAIFPTNDNEHTQDEAVTPAIRGLGPAYNNVTVDGLLVASPGTPNGIIGNIARGVRLDLLPTSMISQLQVVKSFTPDLDPNAIGGAVNIVTRSAFDGGGKPFFTADGALGHSFDIGKPRDQHDPGYRFVATGSTTFGPDHIFGISLSGNYEDISSYTVEHATLDTVYYNFYNNAGQLQSGTNLGNGIPVPQQDRYWYAQNRRTRWGLTAKLEAHPSDSLDAYVTGGYYYFKTNYQRNEVDLDAHVYTTVQNQTPTSGSYNQGYVQVGYINDNIINRTKVGQAGLNWRPDDRQIISLRGSASTATYDENYPMIKYSTGNVEPAPGSAGVTQLATPNFAFDYDTSAFDYHFNFPTAQYYNLQNYSLLYYRPNVHRGAEDTIYTGRLDYAFKRGSSDRGFGFAAGIGYTDDRPRYNLSRVDYEPNNTAGLVPLSAAAGPTPPFLFSNLNLLTIDPKAALAQIAALPASALNLTNQTAFNNQDNFTHHERTIGAYALVGYRSDDFVAEAGFHVDDTSQRTVGNVLVAGTYQPIPSDSHCRYVLPSGIATWHATPSLDLRGAVSQTIGRPSYDTLAARSSVTFANVSDQCNPNAPNVLVTIGNPNLKPRRSTNYDLSLDWVPSKKYGGIISIAGFYKNIKDEIFTSNTLGFTYQGVTYVNAQVSEPLNSSNSSIKGVEFNAIINSLGFIHPWLAGFGISGNASVLAGKIRVPLSAGGSRTIDNFVDQPNDVENASLFYSKGGLEVRAAWNRQGKALRAIQNDIYWQDLYWAPRSQLDLSATYTLHSGAAAFVQASNVTHNRIVALTGPHQNLLRDDYTIPVTVWVGFRFTPHFR